MARRYCSLIFVLWLVDFPHGDVAGFGYCYHCDYGPVGWVVVGVLWVAGLCVSLRVWCSA